MKTSPVLGISIATAASLFAGSALSETKFDAGGKITGSSQTIVHELSAAHNVMMTNGTQDAVATADANNPMNGSSGVCFGMMEVVEGALSGGGYCNFDDAAGERYVVKWDASGLSDTGALLGDWTLIGGNGKWVGAGGGGTFSSLTNTDTGKFENAITGEISLK